MTEATERYNEERETTEAGTQAGTPAEVRDPVQDNEGDGDLGPAGTDQDEDENRDR